MIMIELRRTPIGVDIGRRQIKAAQLSRSRGRYQIAALSSMPRDSSDGQIRPEDVQNLRNTLYRQGFRGNKVVLAVPAEEVLYGVFELPLDIEEEASVQIARMELSRMHQIAPHSFEMAYWQCPLSESKSKLQTIAAGCPHDAVNALVDVFERTGFRVYAMDIRNAAILRACTPLLASPPAITCILDLGWRSVSLLFACGNTIVYERSIVDRGVAKLIEAIAGRFGISEASSWNMCRAIGLEGCAVSEFDPEAIGAVRRIIANHIDGLLEELAIPFNFVNHQYPGDGVERILLIGGGAEVSQLEQYCVDRLDIEVKVVTPQELIAGTEDVLPNASTPAVTAAIGLAKFPGL